MKYDLIAPCYFGTESAAAFDFKRIGAEDIAVTDGRVAFRGGPDIIAAANLWSRCAERVLILLKTYKAVTFDELFDGVSAIPWEELLPADADFEQHFGKKAKRRRKLYNGMIPCQVYMYF